MEKDTFTITKIQTYKKMPDIIADVLRDGILRGTLQGGLPLKQDEIAKKFDVSLIPVREALIQLESKGLVTSVRNKGAIVTPLSLDEMRMIFELRKVLEAGASKIILERITVEAIDKLKDLSEQMEEEKDLYHFNNLNTLFHQLLFDSTQNSHLSETYRNLFIRVERYCMYLINEAPILSKIKEDHKEIIHWIVQKKPQQLTSRLIEHIDQSQRLFAKQVLKKYDSEVLDWSKILILQGEK